MPDKVGAELDAVQVNPSHSRRWIPSAPDPRHTPLARDDTGQSARKNEDKGGDNDSTDDPLHVVVEAEVVLDNIKGGQLA